jgi:hypothetical protein
MKRFIEAYRNKDTKKVSPSLPGKFAMDFDLYQAANTGMGTPRHISSTYSYKEILRHLLFATFDSASERAQYPKVKR